MGMKIMNKLSCVLALLLFSCSVFSSQVSKTVSNSEITGIKVFSEKHGNADIKGHALIYTTKIPGCPRGVFFKVSEDSAIYSSLLTAKVSGHDSIGLVAEDALFTPWGDKDFCGLTSFQLIY
jgi:hypothetical protein